MPKEKYKKIQTKKLILITIFCVVIGFGFGKGEKAEAGNMCKYTASTITVFGDMSESACLTKCNEHVPQDGICHWKEDYSSVDDYLNNWKILTISEEVKDLPRIKSAPNNPDPEATCNWMANPIDCLLLVLLKFMIVLSQLAGSLFVWILDPINITSILSNPAVYSGWTMVRDVLNVSFIMFLLFSAFATVFQIDKYSYKKTLLMIVIMALLVNFSFPITRFIIDISNMMMYYFVDALNMDEAKTMVDFASAAKLPSIINSNDASTTALLTAIIFVFIFAVTILTITVLFVIRTIALAILIIFSSLAFIGAAIPPLSKYSNDWWGKLFSYSFFGPIMLFMIYVSSSLMTELAKTGFEPMKIITSGQTKDADLLASLSLFVIPIVILWMGLGIAQSMSIASAGAVVGQGRKLMNLPVKFSKWGGSTLLNKTDRGLAKSKYMWWASPTAFKTAWKENTAEKERKAFKIATGSWRDKLNKISGEQTNFKDTAIQGNIATKEKELQSTSTDFRYLYNEYKKARSAGDHEKMSATLRIIASNNDLNDFMQEEGDTMDPTNVRERIYAQLTKSGMSKEQAAKQLADIGEISFGKGNFQLFGMGKFNIKTGKYQKNEDIDLDPATGADSGQFAMAAGKASNIKAQTKTDLWHWNSFLQQNADGTTGNIHGIGFKQLESLTPSELGQLNRARKDFFDRMSQKIPEMRTHANSIRTANPTQAGIIDEFIRRVDGFKNDPNFKP